VPGDCLVCKLQWTAQSQNPSSAGNVQRPKQTEAAVRIARKRLKAMTAQSNTTTTSSRHASPHLGFVALAYVVLKIASVFPVSAFGSKPPWFPALSAPVPEVVAYFSTHALPVLVCAFLQVGAAIPFGIFAASAASRLHFLGANAAGTYIALFGGVMAAINEFSSGAIISVMAQPLVGQEAALLHGLHYLSVMFGGPGFTMPFGLMMAGVSVVAGFMKLLPKWVVVLGVLLAVVGELSWLSMMLPKANFLIPLARWPGFVWLIATGFKLPKNVSRDATVAFA